MLHVVKAAQPPPPPRGGPRSCAGPRGVASCCSHCLRVPVSPRAHHAGLPAPSSLAGLSLLSRSTGLLFRLLDGAQQLLQDILGLFEPMPRQVSWLALQQLLRGILGLSEPMPRQVSWPASPGL